MLIYLPPADEMFESLQVSLRPFIRVISTRMTTACDTLLDQNCKKSCFTNSRIFRQRGEEECYVLFVSL